MKKLKFTIHPLFAVFGIVSAFIGSLPVFVIFTLAALEHECGHIFAAGRLGYGLEKVVLMPYGAVARLDMEGISAKDEILVAIAGPLTNAVTAAGFGALWWFFPDTYAYTDTAMYASVFLAVLNLLPAYPLDGGRVLYAFLRLRISLKKANIITRVAGGVLAIGLFAGFIWTLFSKPNISLLTFSLFIGVGCIEEKKYPYTKLDFSLKKGLKRGIEEKRIAVLSSTPLKKILPFLQSDRYLILEIFDEDENPVDEMGQERLAEILQTADIYQEIGEFIFKI